MKKRCSVCNHPSRAEIDRGLLTGVSYRALAAQYGPSPSASIPGGPKYEILHSAPLRSE